LHSQLKPLSSKSQTKKVEKKNNLKKQKFKLVIFDMDGTLLKERTIFVFAEKKVFIGELLLIFNDSQKKSYEKSIEIAKLLKGMDRSELLRLFREIPLQDHVEHVIKELKNYKIQTAIVTNSYWFFANDLKNRLGIDYVFANKLVTKKNIITGDLILYNKDLKYEFDGCKQHSLCKSYVLDFLSKNLKLRTDEIIAVGDGKIDICMLKNAGIGIAFNASKEVEQFADFSTNDLRFVLSYFRI
jgi:HAD superfamily phosphoserine phosphatase-like hydrolase